MSIMIADDDMAMRSLVSDELGDEGYNVFQVSDGREALHWLGRCSPDLIITDLRMPHGGMDLIENFKTLAPRTPIVLMTAFGDAKTEASAYEHGASAFFNKPVRMADLKTKIQSLLNEENRSDGSVQHKEAGYE